MIKRILHLVVLIFMAVSCKKAEDRRCFKSTGEQASLTIELEHFNRVYLGPHIEYRIIQDSTEKIVLEGGKNLINLVEANIEDERLTVINTNRCNFLRTYKEHIKATIHVKDLINIQYDGTRESFSEDTIHSDYLSVTMNESAGKLNLTVNSKVLYLTVNKNWGNFDVKGKTDFLKISVGGNGFGTTYDLKVKDSMHIISNSGETIRVNADSAMIRSQILSSGDIWYYGTPTEINHSSFGSGELLDKN